jgi:hypothetical protein
MALVIGLAATGSAAAQTIFTTDDFRQDRALWTDPAYYRSNSVSELRGMQVDARYGEEGEGDDYATSDMVSPYGFATAWEHFTAWRDEAEGGTRHTVETLPDWDGRWNTAADWLRGGVQPSTMVSLMTPQHQEYFVQQVKAAAEGRDWWATAFCLPTDFFANFTRGPNEFLVRPNQVVVLSDDNGENRIRWLHTDTDEHIDENFRYTRMQGESIGFWDGETLVVHTDQIRGWKASLFEYSSELETVERYRRAGDMIEGEVTIYDPVVFTSPMRSVVNFRLSDETGPASWPIYNSCTESNGPSTKVFLDERGILNERLPGDPLYWDATDERPWGSFFDESDARYRAYLEAGGEPNH